MPLINGKFTDLVLPSSKHARVIFDKTKKWRYRVLAGGRNGYKDWSFAAANIERAVRIPTRFLYTREVQKTIKGSSYQLLCDTIKRLNFNDYFDITRNEIRAKRNGSLFMFVGLNDLVASDLKSMEGIDVCHIGEAENLTKNSADILFPTIRKPGSEIQIVFNPQFDDDFVYEFCINDPPENMICELVSYMDAPASFLSPEIKDEIERTKQRSPDDYKHIWLGEPRGQGGRVYPMYSKEIHEIDFDYSNLPECDLYMSIDPHRKYYPAITWNAVTPTSAVVGYNEWPKYEDLGMWYDEAREQKTFDLSLKELAAIILANDMTLNGGWIAGRTIDPRFAAENPDFVRVLMENGVLNWIDAPFELIETQRENLKSLMYWNPAIPCYGSNTPSFYLRQQCANRSRAYRRHCYSQEKDKESGVHKDFPDADRYFLSIFPGGRPKFRERQAFNAIKQPLISLAQAQLKTLPAQGYFYPSEK
jgi:hypothetical protein